MAVDTIRFKNNLKDSFVLRKFYDIHREELLSLAKLKANDILDIPIDIINSYKSLNFKIQRKVFDYVSVSPVNKNSHRSTMQIFCRYWSCFMIFIDGVKQKLNM